MAMQRRSEGFWAGALLVFLFLLPMAAGQTVNDTDTLMADLFNGYNKYSKPTANVSDILNVDIAMYLFSIQEFNEIEEKLTTVSAMYFTWNDSKLTWDPSQYNDVRNFSTSCSQVWVPDFVILLNPAEDMDTLLKSWQLVWYLNDGVAQWFPGGSLKTSCSVNVAKFPFDTQTCSLSFIAWGYTVDTLKLSSMFNTVDLNYFEPNGRWTVTGSSAVRTIYGSGYRVTFTLNLQRKSGFVVVNVIMPILFLSLLNVLVFVLPVEAGERVSYTITVLLSIAVFMTIVGDTIPKNSEPMAIIAYILMVQLGSSALISIIVILNMRIHYKPSEEKVPKLVKRFVSKWNSKKTAVSPESCVSDEPLESGFKTKKSLQDNNNSVKSGPKTSNDEESVEPVVSWVQVSSFLDNMCFISFLLVSFIVYTVYFILVLT